MSDKPLRIVLATRAPFIGGAEMAALRLGLGLQRAGHHVLMVVGRDNEVMRRLRDEGLRCERCPLPNRDRWRFWRYLGARRRLRRILADARPDIIHSNDLPTHQVVSDAARGQRAAVICHHRFPFDGVAIDWFNRFGATLHLFVSHGLMTPMCEASAKLASSRRAVVYDGLELPPTPTTDDRAQARAELGLPPDRAIVLFAGQMIQRKGVAELLRAWAALAGSSALLVLVGDDLAGKGEYRREMERLALELGLGDRARFVGFQKNVARWLTAADVAAVPSHVEPLGNATLEAMAAALPVVGSNVGGIPEMIVDGQTGLLVPARDHAALGDALAKLIGNATLRLRLGEAGRRRCEEQFSLSAHTQAVLRQYHGALTTCASAK